MLQSSFAGQMLQKIELPCFESEVNSGEEATNHITEVGEDLHTGKGRDPHIAQTAEEIENIESGMKAKMQDLVQASLIKIGCGRIMRYRWGIGKREMIEIPKAPM